MGRLALADIVDLRAYENERAGFRTSIIAAKKDRRVAIGPVVSLTFENAATIRFQIQEMARAERMTTDEAIQVELDTYNPLIPEPGQLSATLFIELVSAQEMETWLPHLVGIERSVTFRIGDAAPEVVRCVPEESHDDHLTRDEITAAVHYIRFEMTPEQVEAFAGGPVILAVDHPAYAHTTLLSDATRSTLIHDLRHGG